MFHILRTVTYVLQHSITYDVTSVESIEDSTYFIEDFLE